MKPETRRQLLIWMLRLTGGVMLLALAFVFCPFEWMAAIHGRIGMGELTYTPLLSYLIRTLSAMYASMGALVLFISFDVRRHHPLIRFLGVISVVGGAGVTILDALLELPMFWTATEGPFTVALGVVLIALTREIPLRAGH